MSFPKGFLCHEAKITTILDILGTAAATDRTSKVIDTAGYDKCLILVKMGAIEASAVQSLKVQHADAASDADTLTSGADIAGSAQTIAADDDQEGKFVDIRPSKRYLQLVIDKDTTHTSDECAFALLYNAESINTTHGDGTSTIGEGSEPVTGEVIAAAASGTA